MEASQEQVKEDYMSKDFSKFIGIPFKDGASSMEFADCWGLCKMIFKEYGKSVPDYTISCFKPININDVMEKEKSNPSWLKIEKPKEPCLITMALDYRLPGMIQHAGVYIGNNKLIHTLKKHDSMISKLDHIFFKSKIKGFYEYVE